MLHFDGDDQATKVRVRSLLDHNFSIVALTQLFSDSEEEEEQQGPGSADFALAEKSGGDSSDEDAPVASLRGRTAAAAARARMSNRSPSASNSSSSAWSPHRRRSATDSSPDISPLAEQPTPPGSQPRRSPRRALAAPAAPAEPHEPHELVEDSSDEETERLESERTKYGAKVVCTTKDKFQPVKSIEWTLADPSKLTDDVREEYPGTFGTKNEAVLLGHMQSLGKQLDVYQLWKHMRPPEWMKRFADTANTQLDGASLDPNYRLTDSAECEVVLGLALAACVHGSGPFDSFFSNSADASGLFPSPGFGRHGVNKNRALILLRVMHLSHGPEQPGASNPNPNPAEPRAPNPNHDPNPDPS